MWNRRPVAAGVILAAAVLAGCAGAPVGSGPVGSGPVGSDPSAAPPGDEIQVVIASTSLWMGPATVLVALEDDANQLIALDDLSISARFSAGREVVEGRVVQPLTEGRRLVRFDTDFGAAGRTTLEVELTGDGRVRRGSAGFEVRDPGIIPAPGEQAPASATPTAFDVASMLGRITSDPIPERSFYWLSVAEALEAHRPFALVLDSFGFRETQACGGALGIMHHLAERFPTVSVIHAEPFATRWNGKTLTLDPPDGPVRLASWSEEWGLGGEAFGTGSVPWVFVVDAQGRVHAVFQGIVGTEELATALGDVSPWTPVGGAGVSPTTAP